MTNQVEKDQVEQEINQTSAEEIVAEQTQDDIAKNNENTIKLKSKPAEWENIFANKTSDKGSY